MNDSLSVLVEFQGHLKKCMRGNCVGIEACGVNSVSKKNNPNSCTDPKVIA